MDGNPRHTLVSGYTLGFNVSINIIFINSSFFVTDLSADPDELTDVATRFPKITLSLNKKLLSIIDYPKVSASVQRYNKQQFINWKQSSGQNYSDTLANLRWHQDWKKDPQKYEHIIDKWINESINI